MRPGVQAEDINVGTGDEAVRGKVASVKVRIFLLNGADLTASLGLPERQLIDLARRDVIAGLRYGIEGMRVGGKRTLVISPHLAYGPKGIPDRVPPNATLRCAVELLAVRDRGVRKPEDYPPGRQLSVVNSGDLGQSVPKWQFGLHEDGRCWAMIWIPIPGMKWRHVRPKTATMAVPTERAAGLIELAMGLPERDPAQCLSPDQVCVDHSGSDGGVHRDRRTDALCLALTVYERGQVTCQYYLAADSPAWQSSEIRQVVCKLIAPVANGRVES